MKRFCFLFLFEKKNEGEFSMRVTQSGDTRTRGMTTAAVVLELARGGGL